jgi:chromosome segregation ATPase
MSNDEMTTQPTIDTLLARLDEWGARFTNELSEIRTGQEELRTGQAELRQSVEELRKGQDELRKGQDELRKGQVELRTDLNAGLRRVERKIEILNDNLLTIKADIRDCEVRLEKLESESLTRS